MSRGARPWECQVSGDRETAIEAPQPVGQALQNAGTLQTGLHRNGGSSRRTVVGGWFSALPDRFPPGFTKAAHRKPVPRRA